MEIAQALTDAVGEIRSRFPLLALREQEEMNGHCTFKIGGPARALAMPESIEEAEEICRILRRHALRPWVLGNGSNVVFPDEGTPKLFVLSTEKLQGIRVREDGCIEAEAGVSLARLAGCALEHGLAGLEFASGIPGSVGGGILMNAGAYGGELKDAAVSVTALDLSTLREEELTREQCAFGYRTSVFQTEGGRMVLKAAFRLAPGDRDAIFEKMKELNARRREKQPLNLPSAGSTFRRPAGYYAAALIDECGLKGAAVGGAQVSEKHAGFLVNRGGATEKELRALMRHVQDTVLREKGVRLEPEIILLPPSLSSAAEEAGA